MAALDQARAAASRIAEWGWRLAVRTWSRSLGSLG
jgi:hypothetical protein